MKTFVVCCVLVMSAASAFTAEPVDFTVKLEVIKQELDPKFCWFHPRLAAIPGMGRNGAPHVVLTLQKHLIADDHYSGLYTMISPDLGRTWTGPTLQPQLDWRKNAKGETVAVCDVTPGWHPRSGCVIAIGTQLRYNDRGVQLLNEPRSYEFAYAVYDTKTFSWSGWKTFDMPQTADRRFYHLAPGCVQWIVEADGALLVPTYYQGPNGGPFSVTVVKASFDGTTLKYQLHGDELHLPVERGLCEPSIAQHRGTYYLTLRNDQRGYVTTGIDGLHFDSIKPWTFDDGQDLGSYNTQQHWLVHRAGLFLAYTRRGANNDHITRNRAPLFLARVDPEKLHVIRATEKTLMPERGVMLGNFGAAAVSAQESWVTDSEFITNGKAHPRGANGSTFLARVRWTHPNAE